MEPDSAVTMSMVQVALSVASLMVAGGLTLWAAYRYMEKRREDAEDRIRADVKELSTTLHARISSVREECVKREDYIEDRRRMETLLSSIESSMRTGFSAITQRIDTMFSDHRGR